MIYLHRPEFGTVCFLYAGICSFLPTWLMCWYEASGKWPNFICPLNQLFLHGYNSVFVMKILWFSVFLGHHCWLSTASIYHNTKELSSESELSCSGPAGAHLLPTCTACDRQWWIIHGKDNVKFWSSLFLTSSARMIIWNICIKPNLFPQWSWFFCNRNHFVVKLDFKTKVRFCQAV